MNARTLLVVCLVALASLARPAASQEPEGGAPPVFREKLDVSVVSVLIRARDAQGDPVSVPADSLEVLEDGAARSVVAVEPVAGLEAGARRAATAPAAEVPVEDRGAAIVAAAPTPIVLYVDVPLAGYPVLETSVRRLDRWIDELCELGPVTLVVANPQPKIEIDAGRDPKALRKHLRELPLHAPARSEVERIRTGVLREDSTIGRQGSLLRSIASEEASFLVERRKRMATWLATHPPTAGPGILLVIGGAYDSDPVDFYLNRLHPDPTQQGDESLLRADLARLSQGPADEGLGRDLAASGWSVFPIVPVDSGFSEFKSAGQGGHAVWLAMAGNPVGSSGPSPFLYTHPTAGWSTVAEPSGGEVVTSDDGFRRLVEDLSGLQRLTYERVDADPGHAYRLEVRSRVAGVEIDAPRWSSESTPAQLAVLRALAALESGEGAGDLGFAVSPVELVPGAPKGEEHVRLVLEGLHGVDPTTPAREVAWIVSIVTRDAKGRLGFRRESSAGSVGPLRLELRLPDSTEALGIAVEEVATGSWGARGVTLSSHG